MSEWYDAWSNYHAKVFGLVSETFLGMLSSWEPIFAAAGYSALELEEATEWLIQHHSGLYPNEHLGALTARIRSERAVHYGREVQDLSARGECVLCGNTGRAIVPHPNGIRTLEGVRQWVPIRTTRELVAYYTAAVVCSCSLGNWMSQSGLTDVRGEPLLSLETYERWNPRWRIQMEQRERELLARAEPGKHDGQMQELVSRLRVKYGIEDRNGDQ